MKGRIGFISDYFTCYLIAWSLIVLSPLWFPIWFALKIYRDAKKTQEKLDVKAKNHRNINPEL